ncbi:MAG: hypothetical protein IKI44_08330 [Bacteroidaceae bacterium]|nr:hypothetical protein [Bacteroidaceae bacterium]
MIQQKLSLFQCLTSVPSKAVGLEEVVRLIRYDNGVTAKTENYRRMASVLGKEKADEEVKKKLVPAFSVGVLFDGNGRGAANVLGFTGLALCDIDHVSGEGQEVRGERNDQALNESFEKATADPHALMVYRTISGDGLRIIYRYVRDEGPLTATSWRAAFLKGNTYFAELTGHDYDTQCTDYSRLSGMAHDDEVYVNWEAEAFVITDEEILEANFDGRGEKGKPRKEYAAGTHAVAVDEAWPRVEQTLARRQMAYQSGHHHDYVMHAAFLFNRYGADQDELLTWAAQEWSDYDTKQREATIRSCYKKTQEHGTWRLNRQGRKQKETSMITLPEIRQWLSQRVEVVYNLVTDQTMFMIKNTADWLQLDERVLCSIRGQIAADTGKRVLKQDVRDVLNSDFSRLSHPVREYVEALPAWDSRDRVKELCSHVSAQEPQYFEWTLHKWLVAAVATWMSDLSSNHEIFVLIGAQGIYKTTFFRHLLPPQLRMYFWENAHNSFSSKDDHLALAENCLVEIEEIDLQSPRDISELKALATSEKVKERRPYARFREEKHRLASFCGSGNQERFLSDETGNRRWLCHKVDHIDDPRTWGLDYDQLYAQLRDELRQGFRYWFDPDEQRRVERQNEAFRIESDEEQLIRSRLRRPSAGEKVTLMNSGMICQFLNGGVVGRGLSTRKVGIIMTSLGFRKVHTMQGNFFEVYQIPLDQIQATLAMTDTREGEPSEPQEGELPF